MANKTYQCSCYSDYPNKSHLNKNGSWKCIDKYEKCEDWKPKSIYGCTTHCRRKAQDMERNCNYCVYHSSGSCAAWECTGTKTVDDIRADERAKTIEEYKNKVWEDIETRYKMILKFLDIYQHKIY